jgi:hypothetical protein
LICLNRGWKSRRRKADAEKPTTRDDGNSKRKIISPYDITSLDIPGLLITQVQLKGENYDEWSRSLKRP